MQCLSKNNIILIDLHKITSNSFDHLANKAKYRKVIILKGSNPHVFHAFHALLALEHQHEAAQHRFSWLGGYSRLPSSFSAAATVLSSKELGLFTQSCLYWLEWTRQQHCGGLWTSFSSHRSVWSRKFICGFFRPSNAITTAYNVDLGPRKEDACHLAHFNSITECYELFAKSGVRRQPLLDLQTAMIVDTWFSNKHNDYDLSSPSWISTIMSWPKPKERRRSKCFYVRDFITCSVILPVDVSCQDDVEILKVKLQLPNYDHLFFVALCYQPHNSIYAQPIPLSHCFLQGFNVLSRIRFCCRYCCRDFNALYTDSPQ